MTSVEGEEMWEPLTVQIKEMKLLREYIQIPVRRNHHLLNLLVLGFNCPFSILESISAVLSTDNNILISSRKLHKEKKYDWDQELMGFQNSFIKFTLQLGGWENNEFIANWTCNQFEFSKRVEKHCVHRTIIECLRQFDKWIYAQIRLTIYWRWFLKRLYALCRTEKFLSCQPGYCCIYIKTNTGAQFSFECDEKTVYIRTIHHTVYDEEGPVPRNYHTMMVVETYLKTLARTGRFRRILFDYLMTKYYETTEVVTD